MRLHGFFKRAKQILNGEYEEIKRAQAAAAETSTAAKDDDELDLDSIGKTIENLTVYWADKPRNIDACPYCGFIFEKPPVRGRKCPECKKTFVVRSYGRVFNSNLLTPEQAAADKCLNYMFAACELTIEETIAMKNRLAQRFRVKEPAPRDLIHSLVNWIPGKFARNPMKLFEAADSAKYAYAVYYNDIGRDPSRELQSYIDMTLSNCENIIKLSGLNQDHVYIDSSSCCLTCRSRHGKRIKIDVAKEKQPLPFKDCTNKLNSGDKYIFCSCSYTHQETYILPY